MPDPKDRHLNKYRMGIAEDYPYLDTADDDILAEVMRIRHVAPRDWFEWGRNRPALSRIQRWLRGAETPFATEAADFIDDKLAELKQFDSYPPDPKKAPDKQTASYPPKKPKKGKN